MKTDPLMFLMFAALLGFGRSDQIATVVNSTGSVYQKDMEDVLAEMKQLRIIVEDWLSPLESEELL